MPKDAVHGFASPRQRKNRLLREQLGDVADELDWQEHERKSIVFFSAIGHLGNEVGDVEPRVQRMAR